MKCISTLCLLLCYVLFPLQANVNNLSKSDTKDIKDLFEYLIQCHDFGYTIFGSKPMSLADINLDLPDGLSLYKRLKSKFILKKTKRWLDAWATNRDKIELKDFIFLDKEEDWINCLIVVLINKKHLLNTLCTYESAFKQELGDSFIPELFLKKLEKREVSLAQSIRKSQKLLGIMLGYGEKNASLFQEKFNIQKEIAKQKKANDEEDAGLTRQLDILEFQSGNFSEFEENPIIPPLYFLADLSHPETIKLKRQYEADRKKIEQIKRQPHFMDNALKVLIK